MFLIKIIIFFILITSGIVFLIIAFKNPIFIIGTITTVSLALYLVGYTSRFSPPEAQVKNYQKELDNYYLSDGRNSRDIFVGIIALLIGSSGLFLITYEQEITKNVGAFMGSLMFFCLGIISLFPNILTRIIPKDSKIIKIEKKKSAPKFYWNNLAFNYALIMKNYEEAECILLNRADTANLDPEQKNIFLDHGKYWINKMRKENTKRQ